MRLQQHQRQSGEVENEMEEEGETGKGRLIGRECLNCQCMFFCCFGNSELIMCGKKYEYVA